MEFLNKIDDWWQGFCEKTKSGRKEFGETMEGIGTALKTIGKFLDKYKGVILAVPVIIGAVVLAIMSLSKLPESVGINLLSNGEFSMMVNRIVAVLVPLCITVFCSVLTIGSKKVMFPWLISLFSLVIPILIYVTNVYPA
ncbi:MAG: hypothetical protein IJW14_04405 [Oscillospiraceae bacterium]|nr:hypothetical protein [Oscillospiraceae bacterium]